MLSGVLATAGVNGITIDITEVKDPSLSADAPARSVANGAGTGTMGST